MVSRSDVPEFLGDRRHPFHRMCARPQSLVWRSWTKLEGLWLGYNRVEFGCRVEFGMYVVAPGVCRFRVLTGSLSEIERVFDGVLEAMVGEVQRAQVELRRREQRRVGAKARVDARNARRAWLWR